LSIAYPEMPPAAIEKILSGMWDNLGRVGAEYVHLDRIWDFQLDDPQPGRIVLDDATVEKCRRLLARRGPVLMFGAHIGNWEVSALAAQMYAPDVAVIYKTPRIGAVADELARLRSSSGATLLSADPTTALRVRDALKRNGMVGILVDEYYADGIDVTMFNRPFRINPLFARFVRIFDCPFHGFHTVRLPDGRLRLEVTDAIEPRRDVAGRIDVSGTMQVIASEIERWVRANPEQWFWLHRRWR
jgi:KDO2-lipid IV(A) lauroyltransferase